MSAVVMTRQERATRLAYMLLTEMVADEPVYPVGLDGLGSKLKAVCDELGVSVKDVLVMVSLDRCDADPAFERRLRRCAAVVG